MLASPATTRSRSRDKCPCATRSPNHLFTPESSAPRLIDYQSGQLAGSARWIVRCWSRTLSRRSGSSRLSARRSYTRPSTSPPAGTADAALTRRATGRRQAAGPDHDQLLGGNRIRPGRLRDQPPQARHLRAVDRNVALAALDAVRQRDQVSPVTDAIAAPHPRPTGPPSTASWPLQARSVDAWAGGQDRPGSCGA